MQCRPRRFPATIRLIRNVFVSSLINRCPVIKSTRRFLRCSFPFLFSSFCLSTAADYFQPTTRIYFPAHVSTVRYFSGLIARNLPRNSDSTNEGRRKRKPVRIRRFLRPCLALRDNLESLPQTGATLCIYVACQQRHRPPFETRNTYSEE